MDEEDKIHELSFKTVIHPLYETFEGDEVDFGIYDFMILSFKYKLSGSLCDNFFARLPTRDMTEDYLIGKELVVSGWGSMIPLTRQQAIDIELEKDFEAIHGKQPWFFPHYLRMVSLPYLTRRICQKRHQPFFQVYKDIKGSKGTKVSELDFEKESGISMMCTSVCAEEDLSKCKHDPDSEEGQHKHKGACGSDSGCK